jgi:hypothetical protein
MALSSKDSHHSSRVLNGFRIMQRRHFLGSGLAASSVLLAGHQATLAALADGPTKRVGLIGTGWYGKCDLFRLLQVAPVEVVSLCDVDSKMVSAAADMVAERQASKKKPRTYTDYRKLLAEKDLDIVLIATPDHWHALPMIEAVKSGADVYVQKPISVDVVEGQAMVAAARKYGRVVQVGTQRRSTPHLMEAKRTSSIPACSAKSRMPRSTVTITCEPKTILPMSDRLKTSTTTCGPALRPCVPTIDWSTPDLGVPLWNMATGFSVTCAFTCSIPFDGC